MAKRLGLLAVAITALLLLLFYSQWNRQPPHVSGLVEADEIRLGSRVGGRVAKVHVEEGQAAKAGATLVELEPFDLLEREKEAALLLAAREAEVKRLTAGYREEEIAQAKAKHDQLKAKQQLLRAGPRKQVIAAARGRLTQATAQKKQASQNLARLNKLASVTPEQDIENAREALNAAAANVVVLQEELALLEAGTREEELQQATAAVEEARQAWQLMQHGYRSEEVEKAQAARDAAKATLEAIGRQKDELKIISPIDGNVEALDLQPGDMVAPGAPVVSMLNPRKLWVRAYVPQSIAGIRTGARVGVTLDGYPADRFTGVITFVSRRAEFTPSNVQTPEERSKQVFRIKVTLEDERDILRPGMTADIWLDPSGGAE